MAISIEMYRMRIGVFSPISSFKKHKQTSTKYQKVKSKKMLRIFIFLTLLISLFFFLGVSKPCDQYLKSFVQNKLNNHTNHVHVQSCDQWIKELRCQSNLKIHNNYMLDLCEIFNRNDFKKPSVTSACDACAKTYYRNFCFIKYVQTQHHSTYIINVNFECRYKFGNHTKQKGLKIAHFNKGPGFLIHKMEEIENIIGGYKPHIFGISESNFKKCHEK